MPQVFITERTTTLQYLKNVTCVLKMCSKIALSTFFGILASSLVANAQTLCGQEENVVAANFDLNNNLWGESAATSGSQCTTLDYDSGSIISWHSGWTWEGGQYNVKSYANAGLNIEATLLSSITSLPTSWSWTYGKNSNPCFKSNV